MNEKNLEFLENNLKYLGFGDKFNEEMKKQIEKGHEAFTLISNTTYPGAGKSKDGVPTKDDTVQYELNFSKGSGDMYFLNNFKAALNKDNEVPGPEQTFYINKGKGITAKESFNLLSGRSVNKDLLSQDGKEYNAWLKIDFNQKNENNTNFKIKSYREEYGFDLEAAIDKSSIKGLDNPETKKRLTESLERGNLHNITFENNGKETKGFVAANPEFKNLTFYHEDLKPVYVNRKAVESGVEVQVGEKKNNKEADAVGVDGEAAGTSKGRKR